MRVSNEPCTDRSSNARRELAHERAFDGLAVYGECRDSEQKAKRLRTCRHGSLRPTRSHARTNRRMLVGSLLTKEHLTSWLYTANAATVSKRPAFASLSAWLIASHPKPCTDRSSNARRELAHERAFDGLAVYGECRDSNISCGAEQTPCVCEPVCMAHCVPPKSSTVRKTGIYLSGKRWKMIQLSQAEKYLTRAVLKKIPRCR